MSVHAVIFAFFAFLAVKVLGYAFAGRLFNKAFEETASIWKLAFARTALGVAGGLAFTALYSLFFGSEDPQPWHRFVFFGGLFFTRIVEWRIAFSLLYRSPKRSVPCAFLGAVWSHTLDTPAWWAFRWMLEYWWSFI